MRTPVFKEVSGKLSKFIKRLLRVEKQLSVMITFFQDGGASASQESRILRLFACLLFKEINKRTTIKK